MDELDRLLDLAVEGLCPSKLTADRIRSEITGEPLPPLKSAILLRRENDRLFRQGFGQLGGLLKKTILKT